MMNIHWGGLGRRCYGLVILLLISSPLFLYASNENCGCDSRTGCYCLDADYKKYIVPNCDSQATCAGGKEIYLGDIIHVLKKAYGITYEDLDIEDTKGTVVIRYYEKKKNKFMTKYGFECRLGIGAENQPYCDGFRVILDGCEIWFNEFLKSKLFRNILKTIPRDRVPSKYTVGYGADCYTFMCNDQELDFGSWGKNYRLNDRVTLHEVLMAFKEYFKVPIHYFDRDSTFKGGNHIGVRTVPDSNQQVIQYWRELEWDKGRFTSEYRFSIEWDNCWKIKIRIGLDDQFDFYEVVNSRDFRKDEFIDRLVKLIQGE